MSRSNAYITIVCDGGSCSHEKKIQLCATARGGYDERYVDRELKHFGWLIIGDKEYCEDCRKEHES